MEGVGELVSYLVTTIFWFVSIFIMLATGSIGFDVYKGVVISNELNRYEQIETDMNTSFTNTDVTTPSDTTELKNLFANIGLPYSDFKSVTSILTDASVANSNRMTISTNVCYQFPVLTYKIGYYKSPEMDLCIPITGLREAP